MKTKGNLGSSFRDPSGYLFCEDGVLYRKINIPYRENYDFLIDSGLYEKLRKEGRIIEHEEVDLVGEEHRDAYKIIRPTVVPFISYPYEWCFSELKDAALTTLEIQKAAFERGMTLKDASAYNIQFFKGKPVLIDTLSFEKYDDGTPWIAYRQFCQHFLAPLALMSYKDIRLNRLLATYLDGIPLDLAGALLPKRTYANFGLLTHIHLHAKSQRHFQDKTVEIKGRRLGKMAFKGLIDSLESTLKSLRCKTMDVAGWSDYYDKTNYSEAGFEHKKKLVQGLIERTRPKMLWDLGANTGLFSRLAPKDTTTIAFDIEPLSVERNYIDCRERKLDNVFPLIIDLSNPSPAIGFANRERMSLAERGPADTLMALALIHHLAISNNLPFNMIAEYFSKIGKSLIIEFVPKSDSQVKRLLSTRKDIFDRYDRENFEAEFGAFFDLAKVENIRDTERTLYLMEKR